MKVFVWGAGRVGRSFARALVDAEGMEVIGAWNRTFPRALRTSQLVDTEVSAGDALPDTFQKADVVLLSVVDDAVAESASLLAPHLGHRQVLLHTSGSLPSTVMAVDGMRARLGGCHPLQSLADPDGDPERMRGSTFAIEGDAVDAARAIAEAVGGRPLEISTAGKVAYHAAAVVSANYLTVLTDVACDLLESAGVDAHTGIEILLPLLEGTVANLARCNASGDGRAALAESLTGPVRRGDAGTIKAHRKAMRKLPAEDVLPLYDLLTARAADVTARVDEGAAQRVRAALPKPSGD